MPCRIRNRHLLWRQCPSSVLLKRFSPRPSEPQQSLKYVPGKSAGNRDMAQPWLTVGAPCPPDMKKSIWCQGPFASPLPHTLHADGRGGEPLFDQNPWMFFSRHGGHHPLRSELYLLPCQSCLPTAPTSIRKALIGREVWLFQIFPNHQAASDPSVCCRLMAAR